jgi:hypothetical protein
VEAGRRTLLLLAVFSLTFLAVLTGVVLWARPQLRAQLQERWRYGTLSNKGMRLTIAAISSGGKLQLAYTNTGRQPRALVLPGERASVEVDVIVRDSSGEMIPQLDRGTAWVASTASTVLLSPGETALQELVLEDFVRLRPGSYRVRVERARLQKDEPRLRSNEISIEAR